MVNGGYTKTEIKGYTVEIFGTYYGDEIYVYKGNEKIYSSRVNRNEGLEVAVSKITAFLFRTTTKITTSQNFFFH